jgi:hypothetical protein
MSEDSTETAYALEAAVRMNAVRSDLRMGDALSAAQLHERWRSLGVTSADLQRVAAFNTAHADALADIRMQLVRNDLLGMLDLLSPAELHARWQNMAITAADLTKGRREAARAIHPDRNPNDAAAALRLAKANAVIDGALAGIKLGDVNVNEVALT